jgi:hypothetical protein
MGTPQYPAKQGGSAQHNTFITRPNGAIISSLLKSTLVLKTFLLLGMARQRWRHGRPWLRHARAVSAAPPPCPALSPSWLLGRAGAVRGRRDQADAVHDRDRAHGGRLAGGPLQRCGHKGYVPRGGGQGRSPAQRGTTRAAVFGVSVSAEGWGAGGLRARRQSPVPAAPAPACAVLGPALLCRRRGAPSPDLARLSWARRPGPVPTAPQRP